MLWDTTNPSADPNLALLFLWYVYVSLFNHTSCSLHKHVNSILCQYLLFIYIFLDQVTAACSRKALWFFLSMQNPSMFIGVCVWNSGNYYSRIFHLQNTECRQLQSWTSATVGIVISLLFLQCRHRWNACSDFYRKTFCKCKQTWYKVCPPSAYCCNQRWKH